MRWAVEQLELRPTSRVLEFGGGPGAAAWLICPQLTTGTLLEIDRSAPAVARIRERCAEHLESGRLTVRQAALAELEVAEGSIDVAFGVNVNLFWTTSATTELTLLRQALRIGGRLLIAYGPGPAGTDQRAALNRVRGNVQASGFGSARIVIDRRGSAVLARRR